MLSASGNVLRANTLVEQTQAIADRIGELSAAKFYGAGVSNAQQYLAGVEAALAAANTRLAAKGIKLADVKGISASFTDQIKQPSIAPILNNSTNQSGTGASGAVTINVNSQLATKSEVGQAVTDALRAYNRTAGPLQIEIA